MTSFNDPSVLLAAASLLIALLNSNERAKRSLRRIGFVALMSFVTYIYAKELYPMLQPGQPINWQTVVLGHGLMFGLLTFSLLIPLMIALWHHTDKAERQKVHG